MLFVMQHWRHKRKSRNADFILIAAKGGDTFPSEPSEPSEPFEPFEPFDHRPVNLKNLLRP